jgi:hypothetical protein
MVPLLFLYFATSKHIVVQYNVNQSPSTYRLSSNISLLFLRNAST